MTWSNGTDELTAYQMYKALLFDMDGVLINSMPIHVLAFNSVLSPFGIELDEKEIAGRGTREILAEKLLRGSVDVDIEELSRQKTACSLRLMFEAGEKLLFSGVKEVLSDLCRTHDVALCTSASAASAEFVTNTILPDVPFRLVIHSGLVNRPKPSPDIYRLACNRLFLDPSECLVIEDAKSGLEAARRAGCDSVLVSREVQRRDDTVANYQVKDITELPSLIRHSTGVGKDIT